MLPALRLFILLAYSTMLACTPKSPSVSNGYYINQAGTIVKVETDSIEITNVVGQVTPSRFERYQFDNGPQCLAANFIDSRQGVINTLYLLDSTGLNRDFTRIPNDRDLPYEKGSIQLENRCANQVSARAHDLSDLASKGVTRSFLTMEQQLYVLMRYPRLTSAVPSHGSCCTSVFVRNSSYGAETTMFSGKLLPSYLYDLHVMLREVCDGGDQVDL